MNSFWVASESIALEGTLLFWVSPGVGSHVKVLWRHGISETGVGRVFEQIVFPSDIVLGNDKIILPSLMRTRELIESILIKVFSSGFSFHKSFAQQPLMAGTVIILGHQHIRLASVVDVDKVLSLVENLLESWTFGYFFY